MTKSLTEQVKKEKFPDGYYYMDYDTQEKIVWIKYGQVYMEGLVVDRHSWGDDVDLMRIKSPVPSYTELTLMTGNYRLAKKALRDCYNEMKYWATMNHRCSKIFNHIKSALVEIEEVK